MSKGIDTDFTGRFCFLTGNPFPLPDFFQNLNPFSKIMWYTYLVFFLMNGIILCCGSLYTLTVTLSNLQVFTFNFTAVVFIGSISAKLLLFIIKYKDFTKIYNQMRLLSHEFSSRNDGYDEIHNSYMVPVMKFGKIRASLEFSTAILYLVQMIIVGSFQEKEDRRQAIEIELPFDWQEMPAYLINTGLQVFGGALILVKITATDIVLLTIMLTPAAQLKYLKKCLQEVFDDKNTGNDVNERFLWFIENHQKVLRVIEGYKSLCASYLCFAYGATMMELFLTGVVVTTPNLDWDMGKLMLVIGNIGIHGLQLYILCFAADILTDAGLTTVSACFSSKLFFSQKKIRHTYSIALVRSVKPMHFTIAGIYPLCANTFLDMIRLTATYFVTVVQIRDSYSRDHKEQEPGS